MRAIVITSPGGSEVLAVQDRPAPEPGLGQVRVRVHTSALNRADLMQREGRYPAPSGVAPDIPGLEYAGEVESVGTGATLWRVGTRVMGIAGGAAHAELLCVHEREAIPIPHGMSYEQAGAIPEAFLTAYDALFNRLHLRAGERVLIHAVASGVGTAALQLARHAGALTLGTSRSAHKLERARELGLVHAIAATDDDWPSRVEAAVGRDAVHAVADLVGGDYLGGNVRVLASRGRLVIVGLTAGRRAALDMGTVLSKRLLIEGTVLRHRPLEEKMTLARDFAERVVPVFESGGLRPIVDRVLPFTEVRAAHDVLASNETFGKVVLRWD
ncbi:MAG: putative quinone oxidoreductase, family [Gemmatimonadetes bacterium]|jgi:NADPH2:quinone reductase|nr:putative quinone oxidoreductase, family [Gemmatimonadota bacterium]